MAGQTELDVFLAPYPDHVVQTMLESRAILLEMLSPVVELQIDATSAVCDGFAYVPNMRAAFVNTAAFANHVTLVFGYGSSLIDRENRLRGEGNQVRHIRLKSAADLRDPYITDLISQASATAIKPEAEVIPELIIKVYQGKKRRPGQ